MTDWVSSRISPAHELDRFDCGREPLNHWLREFALRADSQATARTIVWTRPDDPAVIAYYSVAPTELRRERLARSAHGGHSVIPGYLLARLALDRGVQGRGLGTYLLLDAVELVVAASTTGGGRLLVVDAIDDAAAAFYRAHGFTPITGTPPPLRTHQLTAGNAPLLTDLDQQSLVWRLVRCLPM
ncbi:MAG: GNAT family N-acetyltransferase [Actinobacteria bacterium]|nr:GNAT family N-acetyltransferase [Actinomycetota bacterium]